MIELFASRHPFIMAAASFIAGTVAAVPVAWAGWHFVILPGLLQQIEVIEGTKLVRMVAADNGKRKCIDSMMIRGRLVCLEQGGK